MEKNNQLPPIFENWFHLFLKLHETFGDDVFKRDNHTITYVTNGNVCDGTNESVHYQFDKDIIFSRALQDLIKIIPQKKIHWIELTSFAEIGYDIRNFPDKKEHPVMKMLNQFNAIFKQLSR